MNTRTPRYDDVRGKLRDSLTEARANEALERLARTDAEWAFLKAERDKCEYLIGIDEAVAARYSDETSVDKKKWEARTSSSYLQAVTQHAEIARKFYQLDAERAALRLSVDLYISLPGDRK